MATFALVDARTWIHDYDWTTDSNRIGLTPEAEALESTVFGAGGGRTRQAGLRTVAAELAGFWASTPDSKAFAALGLADRVVTMSPDGNEASVAYMWQAGTFDYKPFGEVGELAPFELSLMGTSPQGLVRGQVAKARGDVSATGVAGSVLNLGAPTSTQFVYAAVHVFTAGTTITIQLQSDTASGFASPTTQATIGPLTAAGGTWMTRLAGPFAGETHWRLNVSAVTGTFNLAAAVAVQ